MDEKNVNWIEDFKKISLLPGDILVIKTRKMPTDQQIKYIQIQLKEIFPQNKFIMLYPGMDLGVIMEPVWIGA